MSASLITPAMADAVGTDICRTRSYPIAASDIRKWALAVYHPQSPPPQFWDGGSTGDDIVAPEEFNPFAWMTADPPGPPSALGPAGPSLESLLGLPNVGLAYMLNGGIEVDYGAPMRPGDVITSITTVADYSEREGRLGPMLISRTRSEWTKGDGARVKTQINTLIRYGTS